MRNFAAAFGEEPSRYRAVNRRESDDGSGSAFKNFCRKNLSVQKKVVALQSCSGMNAGMVVKKEYIERFAITIK